MLDRVKADLQDRFAATEAILRALAQKAGVSADDAAKARRIARGQRSREETEIRRILE
jgi:hypothetical protein